MLGIDAFRKHGGLLLVGAAAITTSILFYQEYQRRNSFGAVRQTHDSASNPRSQTPARPQHRGPAASQDSSRPDGAGQERDHDDDQEDGSEEEEQHDDPKGNFKEVMESMTISRLNQVALKIRIDQIQNSTSRAMSQAEILDLTCTLYGPLCGSYNLTYRIVFTDGAEWYARMPGHGTRFGDLDVQKMDSEYHTMRYIQARTSIPLPNVIFWSTSTDLIGVPFGIVSAVQGEPLTIEWGPMSEDRRSAVFEEIAGYMSQLRTLSFDQIGALRFSDDGTYTRIGARLALLGGNPMDMFNGQKFFNWAKTVAQGPYSSLLDAYISRIEAADNPADHIRHRAHIPILSAVIETMPRELLDEKRFYLHMPDFDWQNIFVGADGRVTGIIDWDNVSSDASICGYAKLPIWLCVDWNPVYYDYDVDATDGCDHCSDMSPEMHRKYRQLYSQAFARQLKDVPEYDPRMTTLSHVVIAIDGAIDDDFARQYIVVKLLKEAKVPFTLFDYCNDFEAGDASAKDMVLREAFSRAWKNGWDTAEHAEDEADSKPGEEAWTSFEVLAAEEHSADEYDC